MPTERSRISEQRRNRPRRPPPGNRTFWKRRLILALPAIALLAIVFGVIIGKSGSDAENTAPKLTAAQIAAKKERQLAREDAAIDRVLDYTTFFQNGQGKSREVALTFDDGPSPYTDEILRILKRTNTPATFFEIGVNIPGNEKTISRQLREGHAIGNHTMNHPQMGQLDAATQLLELNGQDINMETANGPKQRLFRPPYRSFNATTLELLAERNYLMVLWSVDTGDYEGLGAESIVEHALQDIKPGSIVLMHDGGGDRTSTVDALPDIIKGLKKRNLTPVTVPRLALDDPPVDDQPLPDGLSGG